MSDKTQRWFCRECKREWIEPSYCYANSSQMTITGNPINGSNCPICGSPEIELVEFKPQYPGLDIPRDQVNKTIPIRTLDVIPGTTTNKNFSIRSEPPAVLIPFPQVNPEKIQKEIEESIFNWTHII